MSGARSDADNESGTKSSRQNMNSINNNSNDGNITTRLAAKQRGGREVEEERERER